MSRADKKPRSIFDLNPDIFDSCRLLRSHPSGIQTLYLPPPTPPLDSGDASVYGGGDGGVAEDEALESMGTAPRWTCNTCKAEFDSLHDQRSHFKSDVHRLNVKLSIAGKDIVKEEDFYELGGDSLFEDIDVSSTSGSEDELGNALISNSGVFGTVKQKLYLNLPSGDLVSIWRCLVLNESEEVLVDNESNHKWNAGEMTYVEEGKLIGRLKYLVREPRDRTHLRTVLLASGGHFAGCVFDGNSLVAHKTFHRYVVRAKAGKRQSSKDATGKAANSAGSSLRRYNEAALKKEIQDLLVTWMPYINSSSCIFISAPSKNRQLLFNGERPPGCVIYHIPLTVRRPSLKEAKRVYGQLTHMTYEVYENAYIEGESGSHIDNEGQGKLLDEAQLDEHMKVKECSSESISVFGTLISGVECAPSSGENISSYPTANEVTPLHEAAKSGDAQRTLELLEQGLDPCVKDTRGRTPYTLATEKEVRNTFRRFMALNLDKWDWNAANVPSPLTKEIEESQAAKQAEKDAKRKAKAKELKKLRKAKEKAKAEEAASKNASNSDARPQASVITAVPAPAFRLKPQFVGGSTTSKEEEHKKALAIERETRAAAAERRLAALGIRPAATSSSLKPPMPHLTATIANSAGPGIGVSDGELCSCCNASLAGKIPFHRYNYKYCSTSCMYVHKEMLDDDQ